MLDLSKEDWKIVEDALAVAMCVSLADNPDPPCDFENEQYEALHERVAEMLEREERFEKGEMCRYCGRGHPSDNCPRPFFPS